LYAVFGYLSGNSYVAFMYYSCCDFRSELENAIIALGICSVPGYARLMRASVLTVREKEFIESARAVQCGNARIIIKHIVPNAIAPIIVEITMGVGACILAGSLLSFVGLGVQPPTPEWGTMIADGRNVMREHPTLALYPGICVMISVLACNLLGDGLRDALDPRLKIKITEWKASKWNKKNC
jgi:peptide/nickel transport system permease protein